MLNITRYALRGKTLYKANPHFCKNELFFDKNNKEPIFRIRYYGLVLGSSSEIDFTNNKNLIIQNRSKVLKKIILTQKYCITKKDAQLN